MDLNDRARDEFFSEAQELTDNFGRELVALEDLGFSAERVNSLFRYVHTLKGLTSLFGAPAVTGLSHQLESLLDDARMGRVELTSEIQNLLYRSVTVYGQLLAAAQGGGPEPTEELQALLAELSGVRVGRAGGVDVLADLELDPALLGVLTEYEEHRLRTTLGGGLDLFRIHAKFSLLTIDIELEQFKTSIRPLGEVITYLPVGDASEADTIELEVLVASDHAILELESAVGSTSAFVSKVERRARAAPRTPAPADAGVIYVQSTSNLGYPQAPRLNTLTPGAVSARPAGTEVRIEFAEELSGVDVDTDQSPVTLRASARTTGTAHGQEPAADVSLRSLARTVRVDIRKLDHLMNIVGELGLVRGQLLRIASRLRNAPATRSLGQALDRVHRNLERELDALQGGVLEVRMVPLGQVFDKVARVVKQASHVMNKRMNLVVTGAETELDKLIVEELSDPLLHLMRNALDHGIELPDVRESLGKPATGTIALNAYQRGNQVVIELEDDGHGIDLPAVAAKAVRLGLLTAEEANVLPSSGLIDLLFLPGFTTREQVTDLSGRGVGLDIVKQQLSKLGAAIEVSTQEYIGTKILLTLPVTLAIIRVLVVECSGESYCVPLGQLEEVTRLDASKLQFLDGRLTYALRERTLPAVVLSDFFAVPAAEATDSAVRFVVVTQVASKRLGLIVDAVHGQRDIVIKALGRSIHGVASFAGATDLGDGSISLVLDVAAIQTECLGAEARGSRRSEPVAPLPARPFA
jgi:two-component system, chemotaxis family, sensor kinase CheA